jgi:hypothetical protein
MKNIFKFFLVILFIGCITSCSNDNIELSKGEEKELKTELFSVTPVAKIDYSKVNSSIKEWNNQHPNAKMKSSGNDSKEKDMSIINVSYLPGTDIIFMESDVEGYQYSAYLEDAQGIYTQFYMNVTTDDTYYTLNYYPVGNEPFSVKINKFDGTLVKQTTKSAGQRTMDCINDAYSNHGWVSVFLTIETAFIPWTGVAIAAACAGGNI